MPEVLISIREVSFHVHINGLKPHLEALFASHFDFVLKSCPFLHLWPRKLGPFHKRVARPSLIITSLSNFKRRRKNRRIRYKRALSLSWPIRYIYLDHVIFSNKLSACMGLVYRLLVFVKIAVAVWILKKAVGFGIAEDVILNFVK